MFNLSLFPCILIVIGIRNSFGFYDSQPKIISKDGNLIIESAVDKNITFRVIGKGRILANNIDLLSGLDNSKRQNTIIPLPTGSGTDDVELHELRNVVVQLYRNVSEIANNTSELPSRLRRVQQRLRNINRRISTIATKLRTNLCKSGPCKYGGYCIPLYDSFQCQCPDSWEGTTCEIDVDECALYTGTELGCQNNAWCVNTLGSYRCTCPTGYSGQHCTERTVDCLKSSPGALCGNGVCVPAKNEFGYECICKQGWKTDGATPHCSTDVDECESNQNHCHSNCINLPGSFKCGPCPIGYSGNGVNCRDVNECGQNNGGCSLYPKVDCINTEGSYRCGSCPPGWIGDGFSCTAASTNSCPANMNSCSQQADCSFISGVVICICRPGWTGHGFGPNGCILATVDPCENPNYCQNGGTCIKSNGTVQCVCPPGYDKFRNCADPCSNNPCRNGGTCMFNGNSVQCLCPRGTGGAYCTLITGRCGGSLIQESGSLKMNDFQPNMRCVWVIRTNETKILEIKFNKFELDNNTECNRNWLQIHDGRTSASHLLGRFCGSTVPNGGVVHSSHNQLYMWLRTDALSGVNRGFELEWKSINPICGGVFTNWRNNTFGVIKSPGYPGKSPPNRDCSWEFVAPYGKTFSLRFFEVTLGSTATECDDYIEIMDSTDLLEKICASGLPQPSKSMTNKAQINFHTNPNGYDSSFQMHWEIVDGDSNCGGYFNKKEGIFKSPTPSTITTCLYFIEQPSGTRITLEFTKFDIESYSNNCLFNSIEVYDGSDEYSPLIGRFCGKSLPENLASTSNTLLVKYKILRSLPVHLYAGQSGFEAKYKLNCDQLYRESNGKISTPNYPNEYLTDLDCVYDIYAPLHNLIALRMSNFSLSYQEDNCNFETDNLEIYTTETQKKLYCKSSPHFVLSRTNHLKLVFHSVDNPSKAIGFQASYRFMNLGCGGVLIDPVGKISSFEANLGIMLTCQWVIKAPSNYSISLRFDSFDLGTNDCENSLSIFMNTTKGDKHLRRTENKYCKKSFPLTAVYPTNMLSLILNVTNSIKSYPERGFIAFYEFVNSSEQCGGNFTGAYGSMHSPNYPDEYPDDVDCIWIIHAPLGHQIELVVRNFSLENTTMRCTEDYLEVRNGKTSDSPLIGQFCGDKIPLRIPSFTNHLYVKFHSDWSLTETGFYIEWEQTSTGCGGELNSYEGSIHSPHYPDIISDAAQCDWVIHAAAGSLIDFKITPYSEDKSFCDGNRLQIFDGPNAFSRKIKLNCSDSRGVISGFSTGEKIAVRFITNTEDKTNFILEYKANCRVTLTTVHGIIESPNFPNLYPDYLDCVWKIVSKKNNKIHLAFSHVELEAVDQDCIYDSLTVYDLQNNERVKNKTLCRNEPYVFTSVANAMEIEFHTDFSNGAKGFRLEYQISGCGNYFKSEYGSIESPNYPYSVNEYCLWIIEANYGNVIVLEVEKFKIEEENRDCKSNTLVISNYLDDPHPIISACGESVRKVTSNGRMMYIKFETDAYHSRKFFKANYHVEKGKCGGVISASEIDIMSQNYPMDYSPNLYCEWHLRGMYLQHSQISFVTFDLENSTNCDNDYVELYDGYGKVKENLLIRHCGSNLPKLNTFISKKNDLFIVFKTDNTTQKSGWKIHGRTKCGRDVVNATTGILMKRFNDDECVWRLSTEEEGAHFIINIRRMACACDNLDAQACENKNGIAIYDGDSTSSPLKVSFCKEHPPQIISNGQKLTVVGRTGSFYLSFTTYERACGGQLFSIRGKFSSPLYPNSYPSDVSCTWIISARDGNYIDLTFEFMDITPSEGCNSDYVEVRSKTVNGKLLGLYCSNEIPDSIRAFEKMYVLFRSGKDSVGNGFMAKYEYVHENEITPDIDSSTKGNIFSPPLTGLRDDPKAFSWRIMAGSGNLIMLNFKEYSQGLTVFDGYDETALKMEIDHSPFVKISASNTVYITCDNKQLLQFKVEWEMLSKESVQNNASGCHEVVTIDSNEEKNISSLGYPDGYETGIDCEWIFKPKDPATHVELSLYAADLEDFPDCSADYVKIFSSKTLNDWKEEIKQCDLPYREEAYNITIGRPYVKMDFHTDGSVSGSGITTMVRVGCGGYMTEPVGELDESTISFVNSTTEECIWFIELKPGKKIEFNFEFTDDKESDGCPKSYALIRDGPDEDAVIIKPGRICTSLHAPNPIITSSHRGYVKFYFGHEKVIPWKLVYREHNECNAEIHLTSYSNSTNVTTPNYPNIPDPHSECIWIFIAPVGRTIQITFLDRFDFSQQYTCDDEYVELRDGSTNLARQIGKFCSKPSIQTSSSNILYMKFVADVAEPKTGFKAIVSLSKCGGTYTEFTGRIQSENYPLPGGYKPYSACEYSLKVPTFYRINLTLEDVHLPYDAQSNLNNISDHLIIYSISEAQDQRYEQIVATIFGNNDLKYIEVDGNQVMIKFYTYKQNNQYRGFKIKYDRILGRCYKDVQGDSGELIMPRPVGRYMYVACRWKITVPKGRRVSVQVTEIKADSSVSTSSFASHRITFYNDFSMYSKIDQVNNVTIDPILSTDNRMLIRIYGGFRSSLTSVKLRYTSYESSLCPSDITLGDLSGKLLPPKDYANINYYCRSGVELNTGETVGFHVHTLQVIGNNYLNIQPLRFRSGLFFSFMEFGKNITNTNVAISSKSLSVEFFQIDSFKIFDIDLNYKKHSCGGEIIADLDTIINMTNVMKTMKTNYGRIDCAWELRFDSDYNFTGSTNFVKDCTKEFLSIHLGQYAIDVEKTHACGVGKFNFTTTQRYIYLHYHSDDYTNASTFAVNTLPLNQCGGTLTSYFNDKTLSIEAKQYKDNMECIWDFKGRDGFSVVIEFYDRFFIESSENCKKDYVEISVLDKNKNYYTNYPRLCGRDLPRIINTTNQKIQVKFRTDNDGTGDGFKLRFKQYCGGVFYANTTVKHIESPKGWNMYSYSIRCNYTIMGNDNDFINVKFKRFDFARGESYGMPDCQSSTFIVYRQSSNYDSTPAEYGRYCKKDSLEEVRGRNFITFVYEQSLDGGDGFAFDYYLESCGGEIKESTKIHSPFNEEGNEYPHGMECIWNITAPADKEISIRFNYIDYERGYECRYDYIGIYTGTEMEEGNRKALLCGNLTVEATHVKISSNRAIVHTKSDEYTASRGFSAEIAFIPKCDKHIHYTSNNFTYSHVEMDYYTPNGYDNDLDCHIWYSVEKGYQLEIEFQDFNVLDCRGVGSSTDDRTTFSSDAKCSCDFVEIFDSNNIYTSSVGRYCGSQIPTVYQSSGQNLLLRFYTDNKNKGRGFKASIKRKLEICGITDITFDSGEDVVVKSPNFGISDYPSNLYCRWILRTNQSVKIHFNEIDIEASIKENGQCLDYVQIIDEVPTYSSLSSNYMFCGTKKPNDLYFITREYIKESFNVEIRFRSNGEKQRPGFNLTVSEISICNSTFKGNSGIVFKQQLPINCKINFEAPEHTTLSFFLPTLYDYSVNDNCTHQVKFYQKETNELLKDICADKTYSSQQIFLKSNKIYLESTSTSALLKSPLSLNMYYVANDQGVGCGGKLEDIKGYFSSPMYPDNVRNYSNCRWEITVPINNVVTLEFSDFDMGSKINCENDYIQLLETDLNGQDSVQRKFCGEDEPAMFTSKTNKMTVVYKKTTNFDGKGWLLQFNAKLKNDREGDIIV